MDCRLGMELVRFMLGAGLSVNDLETSGWLLCVGNGGRESLIGRSGIPLSREAGISDNGGRTGMREALRYSLPCGLSRVCTYMR